MSPASDGAEPAPELSEPDPIEVLREELEGVRREAAEAKDVARRAQADLLNVQRRARDERSRFRSRALEDVCSGFLPVLDDLGRAVEEASRTLDAAPNESEAAERASLQALSDGVRLVLRRFEDTLTRLGLSEIDALGAPFDPRLHEALQQVPAGPGQADGEVVSVVRRGYLLDGRAIRPTQVVVAVGAPDAEDDAAGDADGARPAEPVSA